MKRIIVTLLLVFTAAACGSTSTTTSSSSKTKWNLQAENTFLNTCTNHATRSECVCALNYLEDHTDGPGDVNRSNAADAGGRCYAGTP